MVTVFNESQVEIPDGIQTLDSFCEWAASPTFPERERGRFSFLHGKVWMVKDMELLFLHNLLKLRIGKVGDSIAVEEHLGYFFTDGALVKNAIAGLATEPDGLFVSYESIENGHCELIGNVGEGIMIVSGTPDMTLEVVSGSSVAKDTVELRDLYWQAGVSEYWLVDARGDQVKFDILKRGSKAYTATRSSGGWLKSNVFGRSFRIVEFKDKLGNRQFTLEVKK